MPIYSKKDGIGQELLMMINGRNYSEFFVGHEKLRSGHADLQILISTERTLVFSVTNSSVTVDEPIDMFAKNVRSVLTVHLSELVCARMVTSRDLVRTKGGVDQIGPTETKICKKKTRNLM